MRWLAYLGWAGIVGLVAFAAYYYQSEQNALAHQESISCEPTKACLWSYPKSVKLKFTSPPSGTTPFLVEIIAPTKQAITLRFDMEGMAMGPAAYKVQEMAAGHYFAKVILPACIQGRSDWRGTIALSGQLYVFKFTAKM